MRQRDLLLHIVPERRLLALERLEQLVGEHLVDGAHAVGPLGVAEAGVVLDEAGMGEEEGGHRRIQGWQNPEGSNTLSHPNRSDHRGPVALERRLVETVGRNPPMA